MTNFSVNLLSNYFQLGEGEEGDQNSEMCSNYNCR